MILAMLETLRGYVTEHPYLAGVGAVTVLVVLHKVVKARRNRESKNYPPNTVILFQWQRGPYAPSVSPFPLKLETYLRMSKIPYQNDYSGKFSKKGKTPFIIYNGENIPDSQFCIEYLNKKLNIDNNKYLNQTDRAVATAFQAMIDEHLYWTMVVFRWVYNKEQEIIKNYVIRSPLLRIYLNRLVYKQTYDQGIGRHSPEEVKHIMLTDLQALSDYLGDKPFLMGDNPCDVDCSAFGLLAQILWHAPEHNNLIPNSFPSLHRYCLRMKEKFWPDWDDCITHGGTRKSIA
ncbi:failed axon connections homolog isoform X2 [Biomphalaria glabrata]|nr:failed axon connections homolog isoform X2 [Biomphalaria glabrata]